MLLNVMLISYGAFCLFWVFAGIVCLAVLGVAAARGIDPEPNEPETEALDEYWAADLAEIRSLPVTYR